MTAAGGQATVPPLTGAELMALSELGVSRESLARLEDFLLLLFRWQKAMNLVAPATLPTVWTRHVIDSLQLLPHVVQAPGPIADLGSGGGFPGVVLAIASGMEVDLFEANQKKAAFLLEAMRVTKATGRVRAGRLEEVQLAAGRKYGHVTARALAPLPRLLTLAAPFLEGGATGLFLKGKDLERELTESAKSWRIKADRIRSKTDSEAVLLVVKEASRV
jgi:16S rRNA (guanine527-N7)-methyltransferase